VGEHDRLDAIAEVELLQDARDMGLDRGLADAQLVEYGNKAFTATTGKASRVRRWQLRSRSPTTA
jgi:hypothetical protein